jgi:hypothetical protein
LRIALVDSNPKSKLYPLPLLKIGAWRKSEGDECVLFRDRLPQADEFDQIWITTVFTYDIPRTLGMVREAKNRAEVVKVGGISATLLPDYFEAEGVEVHRGLIPEAEQVAPDYDLLGVMPDYSISHTSRGCIRKCKFCMVHRLEPEFSGRDWEADLHLEAKTVLFYDNNWFGKDFDDLKADVEKLWRLIDRGQITKIDFNQGLDCRLVTEEIADLLAGLPIRPVRFAFDGMQEDGHYQRAVRMFAERGFTNFMTYVLYNFMDTLQDFYYRIRVSVELQIELGIMVQSFPMRYQPIMEIDKGRGYIGKHWSFNERRNVRILLNSMGGTGGVTAQGGKVMVPLEEFEYWFGKDADEFVRLLSYPKLRQLMERKKGALRMRRAQREPA